ncbi:CatB-related O-acetyltransferase [Rossellomorea sp. y25]|uniref:CatB-related O-acetyltransferase n=1 Tax=Rossellomorea sp. y25 TaxID=3118174 RepID=UPI0030E26BE1
MKKLYLLAKLIKKIQIPAIRNSKIDKTARVCSASHVINTKLGRYSYIGNSCTVVNVTIGSFSSIADNCIIGGASHPIDWVSSSPVFHEGRNIMKKNFSSHEYKTVEETVIGSDVWIGNNCLIKSGVKIENGAVIGMGSVLTKNVGAYEIWAGNPAKIVRKRFDDDIIEKLLESNWWEWEDNSLTNEAQYFNDVKNFLKLGE